MEKKTMVPFCYLSEESVTLNSFITSMAVMMQLMAEMKTLTSEQAKQIINLLLTTLNNVLQRL
jgi:hypothetical protein